MTQWKLLTAIVIGVSASFTFLFTTFARNSDYQIHVASFEQYKTQDLIDQVSRRIYFLQDQLHKYPNNQEIKRELEIEKKKLRKLENRNDKRDI